MKRVYILAVACALVATTATAKSKSEKFEANVESLSAYECPEWFRDAKFGIWAHWGPQSVPMKGDWYAKAMYDPNLKQPYKKDVYKHHVKTYGHPSEFGYKDIIPLWKAEKFDPASLMKLYKKAGAKYFVSMGVHHDNFDLWDSEFNRWNAVDMGPKRDIVGEWSKAAKAEGLRFGISEHLSAAYSWWQGNKGADTEGEFKGVPYDGNDPKNWDLYFNPAPKAENGKRNKLSWVAENGMFAQLWYARMSDVIENYDLDILYSDAALPFGNYGEKMLSKFYNRNLEFNRGDLEAVYLAKPGRSGNGWETFNGDICVEDRERGGLADIGEKPWQTDTSIGDWFYNEDYVNEDSGTMYRTPYWVVTTLVDVVSKNGNMLLNVLQRPDGTIDAEVVELLESIAKWMESNDEAIFNTRPWSVFGEGPQAVRAKSDWLEDFHYTAQDVRYTRDKKDKVLYATVMAAPADENICLTKVATCGREIKSISLLGSKERVEWSASAEAVTINAPEASDYTIVPVYKIVWKR